MANTSSTLNTKIINTAPAKQPSPDAQTKVQDANTLTLSPLSEPAPAPNHDPAVLKEGGIIRIDY